MWYSQPSIKVRRILETAGDEETGGGTQEEVGDHSTLTNSGSPGRGSIDVKMYSFFLHAEVGGSLIFDIPGGISHQAYKLLGYFIIFLGNLFTCSGVSTGVNCHYIISLGLGWLSLMHIMCGGDG